VPAAHIAIPNQIVVAFFHGMTVKKVQASQHSMTLEVPAFFAPASEMKDRTVREET